MSKPVRTRYRYFSLAIALFGLAMIGIVWAMTLQRVAFERAQTIADAMNANANLALAVEEQVAASMKSADQVLSFVRLLYQDDGSRLKLQQLLKDGDVDRRLVSYLGVTDARGELVLASRDFKPVSFADSASFRFHQRHDGGRLSIGKPVFGRITGRWVIPLSLRIDKPDGSFGGIIFAGVKPSYFIRFFNKADLGDQDFISLVGTDGIVRALHEGQQSAFGEDLHGSPLLAAQAGSRNGSFLGPGKLSGVLRLVSFRTLDNYPLILAVGVSEAEILGPFHQRKRGYYGSAVLTSAFILAFALGLLAMLSRLKRVEQSLQESEARYRVLVEQAPDAIVTSDAAGNIRSWNLAAERIFGYTAAEVLFQPVTLLMPRRDRRHLAALRSVQAGRKLHASARTLERRGLSKTGREFPLILSLAEWSSSEGRFFTAIIRDITKSRAAEEKIQQLTKFYAALSQCNQAIVNCASEAELFGQVCRIAVDSGGMKMAWIGLVEESSQRVKPAASHGEGLAFLEDVEISVAVDAPAGLGPTGTAIRENRPFWCQSYLHDPSTAPWYEDGVRFGWGAMAALPLHRNGIAMGALIVYSDDTGAFDEPVRNLLLEMATDISHALDGFIREAERKDRERQLRTLSRAVEQSPVSIVIADLDGNIEYVNPKFEQATGYTSTEVIGRNPRILKSGEMSAEAYRELWDTITAGKIWRGEFHNRRKDGSLFWERASISPILDAQGRPSNFVAVKEDVTEHKAAEEEIQHLAFSDALTQLPNRRLLLDRLQQALAGITRSGCGGALLFIDLDNFKTLNDTLGHDVGDQLLRQVARRLVGCVREGDTVARLGGDEFVVMLEDLSGQPKEAATQAELVGEKIIAALNQPYLLAGHERHSTPSIGVTLFADRDETVDELLRRGDLAMYQAKAAGRNTLRFFDPEIQAMILARAALEVELRRGIEDDQFLLYYQLQVDLDGRATGAEVLLRWQHPERGLLVPAEFIPLAEDTGLILPLGHWVLESACRQLAAWSAGPETGRLTVAVNVSARQFHHEEFVDQVLSVLDRTGADPRKLKLELTESLLLDDFDTIIAKMNLLKARGVSFSLDDFGTGYSSLSYLKRLPLYQLKIDQSFVRDVLTDPNDAAIARTIVALAQILGLAVIAEGVETEAQRDFLAGHGCHAYQGFLYSRPLPLAGFEQLLQGRDAAA
ncbi:MAG TPA: EAL domain-containing protein [Rhodocyclaceae bacterium]|nr:EAL domain-containing protein [Rhodocyclaceae bacterium]